MKDDQRMVGFGVMTANDVATTTSIWQRSIKLKTISGVQLLTQLGCARHDLRKSA